MIVAFLTRARKLDAWLHAQLGRSYQAFMGIGLTLELIKEIKDVFEHGISRSHALIPSALALLLFAALLVHSLGELGEHAERRLEAKKRGRAP